MNEDKKKAAWQDDESWSSTDKIISDAAEQKRKKEEHNPSGLNIPIYSSNGVSLWSIIKGFFKKD